MKSRAAGRIFYIKGQFTLAIWRFFWIKWYIDFELSITNSYARYESEDLFQVFTGFLILKRRFLSIYWSFASILIYIT